MKRKAKEEDVDDGSAVVPCESSAAADQPTEAHDRSVPNRKKRRLHTFERAKLAFEKIQEEKRVQREQRNAEREAREAAMQEYQSNKKKKNQVLRQKTRKGQPNLNGQIELLLEKIQKRQK